MTITLGEILTAKAPLTKIMNQSLPIKASYRLSKLIDEINKEYDRINEMQKKTMLKYGSQKEDMIEVDKDKAEDFRKEFREFLEEEIELPFDPIGIELLEEAKLSAMEMRALSSFFTE